jgi:hypothetical protein
MPSGGGQPLHPIQLCHLGGMEKLMPCLVILQKNFLWNYSLKRWSGLPMYTRIHGLVADIVL